MKYNVELGFENSSFVQDSDLYCFSTDSVILANIAKIKKTDYVVDLGCGAGIISILISLKRECKKVLGVDIDERAIALFNENIKDNSLQNKTSSLLMDVKDASNKIGNGAVDIVISNPPYYLESSLHGKDATSKIEENGSIEDFISCAAKILRFDGDFYMVMKINRLVDTLTLLREYKLEPKELTLIAHNQSSDPSSFVVKAKRGGKGGLKTKMLYIENEDGTMTDECAKLYEGVRKDG